MRRIRGSRALAVVAVTVAVAACDVSTTDPELDNEFDTEAALADYEAMGAVVAGTDWDAIAVLDGRIPFSNSSPNAVASAIAEASAEANPGAFAAALAEHLASGSLRNATTDGPATGPLISGWHRGTTFVYNPESDDYEADLAREGAPETGVRFILYEVDTAGNPIVDQEAGYADLIDEGDDSVEDLALRLHVVWMDAVVLDYATTLDHDVGAGALTVAGFIQGDGGRLDFDIGIEAEETQSGTALDIAFEMWIDARDFRITGSFSGLEDEEDGDGDGTVDLLVSHGPESMQVEMTGQNGILDGTLRVNGNVFATVTGPEDDPIFLNANGEPLLWNEVLVLYHVVDVVEDVFDLLEDLLDPVDELLLLGFIL